MSIEINHTADKFKCELSNIDRVLEKLKSDPASLNTGASARDENESYKRDD